MSSPKDTGKPFEYSVTADSSEAIDSKQDNVSANVEKSEDGKKQQKVLSTPSSPVGSPLDAPQIPMELMNLRGTSSKASEAKKPTTSLSSHPDADGDHSKRRSSRAIKRKKFDDEIIDNTPSNQLQISPGDNPASPIQTPPPPTDTDSHLITTTSSFSKQTHFENKAPLRAFELGQGSSGKGVGKIARSKAASGSIGDWDSSLSSKKSNQKKSSSKKPTNKRTRREGAWKDLSRWKPMDDLALISSVLQTNDLAAVYRGVKFSCHFTFTEMQDRWNALLYEPIISKMALQAIRNLHPENVVAIQKKTLFGKQEEELLFSLKANSNPAPTLKDFEALLAKNSHIFHSTRTPVILMQHWQKMKFYSLLPDQSVQPLPKDKHIFDFFDAEASINDGELFDDNDETVNVELTSCDRRMKKEIRHLEAEISKWQLLVDKVRGDNSSDIDNHQNLAVLRGRLVRYLMRSKEITFGRSTKDQRVDVDLKLEGPASKISRKQGVIKLKNSGEFFIANEGKRSFFVDGRPILPGSKAQLCNNTVLEIAGLKFVFIINQVLIDAIRQEATKLYQSV